ncbi:MAG: APC family permease [Candidatus Nomurabacteria bacterium]|nr:MAG: APC family permease [Candidatus Nomurabacteria bacterium]
MWDSIRLSTVGGFTLRKIALLLMAVLTSAVFMAATNSPTSFAVNASWNGDSISYNGNTYDKVQSPPTLPGVPINWNVYSTQPTGGQDVSIIAIDPSADTTKDVSNAKSFTYSYDGQIYSNPRPPNGDMITVSANTSGANGDASSSNSQNHTSCAVTGVGWIICSVSRWIADGMDHVFNLISGFLTVRPLTTDTNSGMYQAWTIARNLANTSFIVAFLVIIYAQISTYGISNYELKKMIPRLIIAAILVNVSYYICTVAVDVSNILGDSVQQALVQIRQSLPAAMPGGSVLNWKSMTEFLLSGGTVVGAGLAGFAAFTGATVAGSMTGLVILLFPILIAGILSVLVALIVLAARQALITVLVIISPLAFVAFLLPNTEKFFERWRKLLTTLLLVFPMFSLLYGGSQLASYIVIQNTDQISVMLLAMFIQVAPLALTPFLIRFSGSLMGQLAGMLNKPRSTLVGQAKNFAQDRSKTQAAKGRIAAANGGGTYFQQRALRRFNDQKDRDAWQKSGEAYADASWHNDKRYRRHHTISSTANLMKESGEAIATREFEHEKAHDRRLQKFSGVKRLEDSRVKQLQAADNARWEEAVTGKVNPNDASQPYAAYSQAAHTVFREQRIADSNAARAQAVQQREYANELTSNVALQQLAGGSIDKLGAVKVKAQAMSEVIQASQQNVESIKTASHVKAGDINEMRKEFDKAVRRQDVDSLRAYADMLGNSKDPGIRELRKALNDHHADIKSSDMHETFMHFLSNNGNINNSAKDIGDYSRDVAAGYRKLSEVSSSAKTWKNMDANQFAAQKASSQVEALKARDDNGNWAISRSTAVDLMKSVSWENIKTDMKPLIRARAEGRLAVNVRTGDLDPRRMEQRDDTMNPPDQQIPDSMVPPE